MATGTINQRKSVTATITSGSGGTNDHSRLTNRDAADQHPISSIIDLQRILDSKLDSGTALPLIEEAVKNKAKGLYYDATCELAKQPYWYVTADIDPVTKLGTKESIISGPYNLGAGGGGGGGGGVSTIKISKINEETGETLWPAATALGSECNLGIYWTSKVDSEPTGAATISLYINEELILKKSFKQGAISFGDVSSYLNSGSNKVEVKILDAYSTSKNLVGDIAGVTIKLESNFDDSLAYTGSITYSYTPYGDIVKTMHFIVDGVETGTATIKTTGELNNYIISGLSHGSHSFCAYFTANIDGEIVESNKLNYDLIHFTPGNTTPIIASTFAAVSEQEQYVMINIPYRVYTPGKNTSDVELFVNGAKIGETLTVDQGKQVWAYRPMIIGNYIMKIKTGTVERDFSMHVGPSRVDVEAVSNNLALALNAEGRSNTEPLEARQKWEDKTNEISCTLSGFNWSSNGWMQDDEGSNVLRIAGSAKVEIPYKPFAKDFTQTGKTFEFEIATSDVKAYDSIIISCLLGGDTLTKAVWLVGEDDRTKRFEIDILNENKFIEAINHEYDQYIFEYRADGWAINKGGAFIHLEDEELETIYGIKLAMIDLDPSKEESPSDTYFMVGDRVAITFAVVGRGFYLTPQLAKLQAQQTSLSTQYKENDHVRLTFVVEPRTISTRLVYMYINGVMSGIARYPTSESFLQSNPQNITIGTENATATIDIYNIRIYDMALSRKQVVNNWIADTQNVVTKADRYYNNDNYDETGNIVIAKLPGTTPYMTLIAPTLPAYKKDRKYIEVSFVYPGDDDRCFTAKQARADVQGTSSQYYYKKNFKIKYEQGFIDKDGEVHEHYHITPSAKKEKEFTYKADVASSEGTNNVELVRYFEDTKNFDVPPEKIQDPDDTADGYETKDRIRVGIDGFPIVMFHDAGNGPKFYGKMNFLNDKGNKRTFGFADGDECWEFTNNSNDLVLFKNNNMSIWKDSFESRYPEKYGDDDHAYGTGTGELDKLTEVITWVASTRVNDTDTAAQKEAKLSKFKRELTRYFDQTSALFYYLYTELFLMVDSRAKNAMMCYYKSRQAGDGGNKWFWIPYDMDTALGINNEGLLVFDYDAEDTDLVHGANVYNGQQSTFWCNIRDAFKDELRSMYTDLRAKVWSFDSIESYFEKHQSYWSESIFNEDSYAKYIEPLVVNNDASYLGMAQGSKAEQRRWWMYNRFKYLDSKYRTGDAAGENIMLRVYAAYTAYKALPTLDAYFEKYDDRYGVDLYYFIYVAEGGKQVLKAANLLTDEEKATIVPGTTIAYKHNTLDIIPFINCHTTVIFDQAATYKTIDAEKNAVARIVPPDTWNPGGSDAVMTIYSADILKDAGDLSAFKPGYANFSAATKLQRLKLGSTDAGFENSKLTGIMVGNNHLLTEIDARNCTNLGKGSGSEVTPTIDLSQCISIEKALFDNTQILGCQFPIGGYLKEVSLPSSITMLEIRNHPSLQTLRLAGTDNIESLWLENIPASTINPYTIIKDIADSIRESEESTQPRSCGVRLIDIDTTFDSWEKIISFYDNLDLMYGKDMHGDRTDKAQVTGVIHVDYIAYADYVTQSARYPEITIDATTIVCTVNFWNEDILHESQSIPMGRAANTPADPEKQSTQQYYWTFSGWDSEFGKIMEDMDIHATYERHIQVYRVTFNTESRAVADPSVEDVEYGCPAFMPQISNVPESVEFLGWFYSDGTRFDFEQDKIYDTLELHARWYDENSPIVALSRKTFNKFAYNGTDNVGIVSYGVTRTNEMPETWTVIPSTTEFVGEYEIDDSGDYYMWVRDAQNNMTNEKILSEKINIEKAEGVSSLSFFENDVEMTDFALSKTKANIRFSLDSHYENLVVKVNGTQVSSGDEFEINKLFTVTSTCDRKKYRVSFDVGSTYGTAPETQIITYLHKAEEPAPQYDEGHLITSWYFDEACSDDKLVDFDTFLVEEDTTLYAKWEEYHEPTKINIATPSANEFIVVTYRQTVSGGTTIDWGDGSIDRAIPTGTTGYVEIGHTYTAAGDYQIKLYLMQGQCYLGKNYDQPAIMPISYITSVEFAWDVTKTNDYAFRNAVNMTSATLTNYMTSISTGTFYECTGLTELSLTRNLTSIGARAFEGCENIETEIVIGKKLRTVDLKAFSGCKKISNITIENKDCYFGAYAFENCISLTEIPDGITSFSLGMFSGCEGLTEAILGEDITTLGGRVFNLCSSLEKVVIKNPNIQCLSNLNFSGCPQLTSAGPIGGGYDIEFAFSTKIPDLMFSASADSSGSYLTEVHLPVGLKEIGQGAFYSCRRLTEIDIPDTVTTIGTTAFADCISLNNVTIPFSAKNLGFNLFQGCVGMTDAYIKTTSTNNKVDSYEYSWFFGTYYFVTAHIPSIISYEDSKSVYGQAWDLCGSDTAINVVNDII